MNEKNIKIMHGLKKGGVSVDEIGAEYANHLAEYSWSRIGCVKRGYKDIEIMEKNIEISWVSWTMGEEKIDTHTIRKWIG